MQEIQRAHFKHYISMPVRWGDMDAMGHVNNTLFYRYAEEGRIQYFINLGAADPAAGGDGPILADLRCSFRQQLHYPSDAEVATRTRRIGNSSIQIQQALFLRGQDDVVASFACALVWFDFERQTSTRVPESLRAAIRALEVVQPEE